MRIYLPIIDSEVVMGKHILIAVQLAANQFTRLRLDYPFVCTKLSFYFLILTGS